MKAAVRLRMALSYTMNVWSPRPQNPPSNVATSSCLPVSRLNPEDCGPLRQPQVEPGGGVNDGSTGILGWKWSGTLNSRISASRLHTTKEIVRGESLSAAEEKDWTRRMVGLL